MNSVVLDTESRTVLTVSKLLSHLSCLDPILSSLTSTVISRIEVTSKKFSEKKLHEDITNNTPIMNTQTEHRE